MRPEAGKIGGGLLGLLLLLRPAVAQEEELVRRGREVYVAEGCIHCHSQYVRPDTGDEVRWGPARSLKKMAADQPPLLGNRRQGPDLLNVGARRNAEWQRLHLQAPRALTPGSRMPSYAHLFRDRRKADGEALVAYLCALGADTKPEFRSAANQWRPTLEPVAPRPVRQRLFQTNCAACHGATGRGDGPLARQLTRPVRDLTRTEWTSVPRRDHGEAERLALARIIKFGLPDSVMAGHEYLPDDAVAALAAYVQELCASP